ncbi:hypothetical protein [Nocardioides gilvus]|uniref:hypothetical protein n=1 Tax=Nocardioides gilvus TaxID=1735589 RepID=UPI000D7436AC|nr:hypothetical protein [Nocardioides gilvus]
MALTRAAVVACLVALLCLSGTVLLWLLTPGGADETSEAATADPGGAPAVEVVRAWDAQRSRAWASGSLSELEGLYVDGSRAGRRDAAMLRAYVDRGLVVEGLDVQLISVEEVRRGQKSMVLDVTDRVHAGRVVGEGVEQVLPRDGADTRRLVFRLVEDRWVLDRVADRSDRVGQAS